jgi:hypothetical protein
MHKCGLLKFAASLPAVLAIALISFISWVFLAEFMPNHYDHQWTANRTVITVVFTWFSVMSYVFIVRILTSDPGYLDPKYEHALVADGMAPLNQLRVYNLRHY